MRNVYKSNTFWDKVCEDYNKSKLAYDAKRLAKLIEDKMGGHTHIVV
jgi:hypothetical protein